jgi:flavodoxin
MKTLVVYYSRTGMTRAVAQAISKELRCDIEEVVDEKDRAGPLGWLSGGKDAFSKKLTKIKTIKFNPKNYDLVIIGSPIWAGTMTPAIRTYLVENKIENLAAFCTMGGNNPGVYIRGIEEFSKSNAFVAVTTSEVKSGKIDEKIKEFVQVLSK